jgi:hypothetical protein
VEVAITADEERRIEERDWTPDGIGGRIADARLDESSGETRRILKRRADGACIFLDAEERCLVERRLGWDAKPLRCKLFPVVFVEDPDGRLEAVATFECRSIARSFEAGTPLCDRPEATLVAVAPRRRVGAPEVELLPGRRAALVEARALLDDAIAAGAAEEPFADLPWRVSWAVKRALGTWPPPYPFEGPVETPFYQALAVAGEFLAPQAAHHGWKRLEAGIVETRRWMGFRKTASRLEPAAERLLRLAFRTFLREGRAFSGADLVSGIGACLFATLSAAAGAARIAEVLRGGARASATEAGEVASEAAAFLGNEGVRRMLVACREALARIVLDATKASGW